MCDRLQMGTTRTGDARKADSCTEKDIVTFEPRILKREGGYYYLNVCGTLRANAGDNQMSIAYNNFNKTAEVEETAKHYWMTDKAGHLCRFTKVNRCNTLKSTDYKDPPVILVKKYI